MIEPDQQTPAQPDVEVLGEIKSISTTKLDWGTKVAYDITIRTLDPNALALGTLKGQQVVKVKVTPYGRAERANTKKDFK